MHFFKSIHVSGGDHDEVAGNRLRFDESAGASFGLARDGVFFVLERRQETLLGFDAERVDLVDEKDASVGFVNVAGFDAFVRRGFKTA